MPEPLQLALELRRLVLPLPQQWGLEPPQLQLGPELRQLVLE